MIEEEASYPYGRRKEVGDEFEMDSEKAEALAGDGLLEVLESTPDPLDGVAFASDAASKAAREAGLKAGDFDGEKASGESGFTKADVTSLAEEGED